jgi:hypothetical protein
MAAKKAPFGGKKAAPFGKGAKEQSKTKSKAEKAPNTKDKK